MRLVCACVCALARVFLVVPAAAAAAVLVPWVYQKHYDQARELRKTGGSAAAAASEGPAAASGSPASASVAREETFYRYYRVFSRDDLLGLCAEEKRVKVLDCYNDTNNWAVLLERLST